jgi:hypothetical protein
VVRLPDENFELWEGGPGGTIVLHIDGVASNTVWFFAALPQRCGWGDCPN